MLNSLHLVNFRRHADTELAFSSDAQIILISGRNGAGKSTILEAMQYAIYGESRHGKRHLSKLVRRGAELEGMQVDLSMTVGDVTYDVVRRLERGKSSAQLYANGNLVMQGAGAVTGELSRVLGMDAVGFRLAVIAQQKELDGLADLTSAKRKATMSRLLRLDAITKAAGEARDIYHRQKDIAAAMGAGVDLDALNGALVAQQDAAAAAQAALVDARAALAAVDAALAGSVSVDADWQAAQLNVARAEATATSVLAECDRLAAELAAVRIPEPVAAPEQSEEEISEALVQVESAIGRGESSARLLEQAAHTRSELAKVTARLTTIEAEVGTDTPAMVGMDVADATEALAGAEEILAKLETERTDLLEALSAVRARKAELAQRAARAATLGEICDACEQPISEQHKHSTAAARDAATAELAAAEQSILADGARVAQARKEATVARDAARSKRETLQARRVRVDALLAESDELNRRRGTYTAQLDRLADVAEVDLEELYARKAHLAIAQAQARQAGEVARVRELATARRDGLASSLAGAQARYEEATAAAAAAAPGADLVAAFTARQELLATRADEAELVAACEAETLVAAERVAAAQQRIADAATASAQTLVHKQNAAVAAKTATLLTDVAHKLATEIRPALQGEVAKLLTLLSEGRFTSVQISEDYDITVLDDGSYEPVTEFSGGEADLIALAVRLALANVVADRHGAGGAGFLILDEVFGSQDTGRREAILTGLRNLRGMYGQIFLISHVGGLEEDADMVLEVSGSGADRVADVQAA